MRRPLTRIDPGLATYHKAEGRQPGWKAIDKLEDEVTQSVVTIYVATGNDTGYRAWVHGDLLEAETPVKLREEIARRLGAHETLEWVRVIELTLVEGFDRKHYYRNQGEIIGGRLEFELRSFMLTTTRVGDAFLSAERRDDPDLNTPEQWLRDARKWGARNSGYMGRGPTIKKGEHLKLPIIEKRKYEQNVKAYIPYTDGAWAALNSLADQIERVREGLMEYLGQPDIAERLESVGVPLLAAPKED